MNRGCGVEELVLGDDDVLQLVDVLEVLQERHDNQGKKEREEEGRGKGEGDQKTRGRGRGEGRQET